MIFGTIASDTNEATKSLTLFGKRIKDIVRDYKSVSDDKIGFKKIGAGLSGIFNGGLSDSDIKALRQYNELIANGEEGIVAYNKALKNAGDNARLMAEKTKYAEVNIDALTTSEKIATVATQALSAAMNAALAFGVSWLVSKIISGIQDLTEAEEKAREAAKEMRQEADSAVKSYQSERETLDSLISEYVTLYTTTSDLSSAKNRLLEIQKQINNEFVEGKDKVDLLNKSLKENLEIARQQAYLDSKSAEYKLRDEYTKASSRQSQRNLISLDNIVDSDLGERVSKELKDEANKAFIEYFNSVAEQIEVESKNPITGEVKTELRNRLDERGEILGFASSGQGYAYDEYINTLDLIIEKYEEWGKQSGQSTTKTLKDLRALRVEVDEIAKSDKGIMSEYDEIAKFQSDFAKINTEEANELGDILSDAAQKINELNQATNLVDKFAISQEINDLRYEAEQLAGNNVVLTESVTSVFDAYSQGFSETLGELSTWREAWFKTLDEVQQSGLKNVEMMQNALSTLMSGEGLSGDDFWKLAELDTDKILSDVQMIGDKFYLNENQVIQLKDAYINKNVEQLKSENQILLAKKKQAEIDALSYQNQLNSFSLTMLDVHNPRYAEYNQQFEQAKHNLDITNQKAEEYGEHLRLNNVLVAQWESGLGAVAKTQDAINQLAKKFQEEADNRLKAQEYKVDQIVDGIDAEKSAIEDAKAALEDQLSILKEQEDELKEITENYEKVANTVQSAIKEQIDDLKAQNEEREEALSLAEKLANLENAKNNKVRTYTEAGGWQYEAKKSDVEKAQREVDKAKVDQEIKVLEEYLKKWENVTGKRQKAEDEQLAEQILGVDWRQKIAKQDEDIFNKYEEEYDSYGNQLNRISNIEMQTLQKEIDIKNKEIAAKEAQIKEWQKYKSAVQKAASDAKAATSDWYKYLSDITLNEDSTLDERNRNLEEFAETYSGLVEKIAGYTSQIGDMTAAISFDTSGLEDAAEELEEFFNAYREGVMAMADAYNADDNHFGLVNSEWDAKLLKAAKGMQLVHSAATGRVVDYTGLLAVHGTKQKSETIFNANDSKKLYDYIHNTPNVMADMITGGYKIAQNLPKTNNDVGNTVTFNGTVINLPNVQNPEQFARQMEMYMQTVLSESQVYKPRR